MKPELWGPHAWIVIHSIAYDYPKEASTDTQQHAICFINSLTHLLPCRKCRHHLSEHLNQQELRRAVAGRDLFFAFTVDLHNIVNATLGKPAITTEQAQQSLVTNLTGSANSSRSQKYMSKSKYLDLNLLLILIPIIILILYVKK